MRRKRPWILLLSLLLSLTLFAPLVCAEDGDDTESEKMPSEFRDFLESIPDDIRDLLPDGLFSDGSDDVGEAVREMSSFSYLLHTILSLLGAKIGGCARILASVAGLLLLSAVCHTLQGSFGSAGIGRAFSFCTSLVIMLSLLSQSYSCLTSVTAYFKTLTAVSAALLPLLCVLYAMGGNVGAAAATSSGLTVFMTVLEEAVGKTVVPFCGLCMAFALMQSLNPALRTGTLISTVKKNYTTALAFLMMLLLAMLAAQTTLAARGDTLAMKSAKFAAGNLIPVVGGSVSELLRTVSASVSYLRGTVGICGVLLLLFTLLPTLIELLLLRLTWQLAASLADLLGCDGEKKLLDEFASLLGYLVAAVSICSSVILLALSLLTHCASALG
ncbi:MAG: hypothetical protein J6B71_00320 [Clostridia bacterium]|nr:hypothetical protein [Clostridia bacterium]